MNIVPIYKCKYCQKLFYSRDHEASITTSSFRTAKIMNSGFGSMISVSDPNGYESDGMNAPTIITHFCNNNMIGVAELIGVEKESE